MFGAGEKVHGATTDPTEKSADYEFGYFLAKEAFGNGLDLDTFLETEEIPNPEELKGFKAAYRELLGRFLEEEYLKNMTAELRRSAGLFVENSIEGENLSENPDVTVFLPDLTLKSYIEQQDHTVRIGMEIKTGLRAVEPVPVEQGLEIMFPSPKNEPKE